MYKFVLFGIAIFLLIATLCFAEEEITITTYYPSPYGSYNELTTFSNTYLATGGEGNVGIGTTGPMDKLHVYKQVFGRVVSPMIYRIATFQVDDMWLGTSGTGTSLDLAVTNSNYSHYTPQTLATIGAVSTANDSSSEATDAAFFIKTLQSGSVSEKFRITNAGNVGIGTAGPGVKLDVNGEIRGSAVTVVGSGALPSPNEANRGKLYFLQGGAGAADGLYVCEKNTSNTYDWKKLGSPTLINIWNAQSYQASGSTWTTVASYSVPAEASQVICTVDAIGPLNYWGQVQAVFDGTQVALSYDANVLGGTHYAGSGTIARGSGPGSLQINFKSQCDLCTTSGYVWCWYTTTE